MVSIRDRAPRVAAPLGPVTTPRLDLRPLAGGDLDELAEVFSHREVWQFPFGRSFTYQETQAFLERHLEAWSECEFGLWAVRTVADGRMIGYLGLSVPTFLPEILPAAEVGWRLAPTAWGQGYATEGATAALDEGFITLGLESVCSVPQSDNPRSFRVAERLGMTLTREVPVPANGDRREVRCLLYEMDRRDWLARTPS